LPLAAKSVRVNAPKVEPPVTLKDEVVAIVKDAFVARRLVANLFVDVAEVNVAELVIWLIEFKFAMVVDAIVPVATVIVPVARKFVVAKLVIVALVMVALIPNKFIKLLVEALVVEAFKVKKLPVVPQSVVMVALTAFKIFANKFVRTFKLVIEDVAATNKFVLKLVEVELVIVELVVFTPSKLIVFTYKFVTEAEVNVALVPIKFVKFKLLAFKLIIEELAIVEVDRVVVPTTFTVPSADILILSTGVTEPLGVVMKTNLPGILFSAGVPSTEPRIIAPSR
jgi:hypothetical protein